MSLQAGAGVSVGMISACGVVVGIQRFLLRRQDSRVESRIAPAPEIDLESISTGPTP